MQNNTNKCAEAQAQILTEGIYSLLTQLAHALDEAVKDANEGRDGEAIMLHGLVDDYNAISATQKKKNQYRVKVIYYPTSPEPMTGASYLALAAATVAERMTR